MSQQLEQAADWALVHFVHADQANAAMHCAPVRYSPITFRLAESLDKLGVKTTEVVAVMADKGRYDEDPGR